ncbi:hypothetical protein ACOSQ4_023829 [Xanthoceras sorbifolium]
MEVSLLLRHNTSSIVNSSNTGMSLAREERWSLLTLLLSLKIQIHRRMTAPPAAYASSRLFSHRLTTLDKGVIASVSISKNLEISGDGALLIDQIGPFIFFFNFNFFLFWEMDQI